MEIEKLILLYVDVERAMSNPGTPKEKQGGDFPYQTATLKDSIIRATWNWHQGNRTGQIQNRLPCTQTSCLYARGGSAAVVTVV